MPEAPAVALLDRQRLRRRRSPDAHRRRAAPVIPLRDANPTRRTPVVTLAMIAACVVVFVYQVASWRWWRASGLAAFITRWGVVPAELVAALGRGRSLGRRPLTLVTSLFLHGGSSTSLGNMLFLWIFGNNVEDRFGRLRSSPSTWSVGSSRRSPRSPSTRPRRSRRSAPPARSRRPSARTSSSSRAPGSRPLIFLGLLLPAHRRPGGLRARLLVRAPAVRRPRVARRDRPGDVGRRGVLRPHRRVRLRRGRRRCSSGPRRRGRDGATGAPVG